MHTRNFVFIVCAVLSASCFGQNGVGSSFTMKYRTRDGSAVAGIDYTKSKGTANFVDGELVGYLSNPISSIEGGSGTLTIEFLPHRKKWSKKLRGGSGFKAIEVDVASLPKVPEPYCPPYK